jgi:hypothetical protein
MGEIGGLLKNAAAHETRGGQAIDDKRWPDAVRDSRQAIAGAEQRLHAPESRHGALHDRRYHGALEQYQPRCGSARSAMHRHRVLKENRGRRCRGARRVGAAVCADLSSSEAQPPSMPCAPGVEELPAHHASCCAPNRRRRRRASATPWGWCG